MYRNLYFFILIAPLLDQSWILFSSFPPSSSLFWLLLLLPLFPLVHAVSAAAASCLFLGDGGGGGVTAACLQLDSIDRGSKKTLRVLHKCPNELAKISVVGAAVLTFDYRFFLPLYRASGLEKRSCFSFPPSVGRSPPRYLRLSARGRKYPSSVGESGTEEKNKREHGTKSCQKIGKIQEKTVSTLRNCWSPL